MNKKRGFTLIEIIICIALIAIIGTAMTFVIINNNKNKQIKTLEKNNKVLENALEVYLENHDEIQDNLENNAKGAVVTLEVLKNEGLIDEKQYKGIDLKETYFFLSYSMLSPSTSTDCDNDVVPLSIISSWNVDTDKVVYICPRSDSSSSSSSSSEEDKSNIINQFGNSGYYIAKGANPNNYVKFEVTAGNSSTDLAYFPNDEDKDLWRIVSIDENGGIKLIYNKAVPSNNQLMYKNYNPEDKDYEGKNILSSKVNEYLNESSSYSYVCTTDKCFYPYSCNVKKNNMLYNYNAYYTLNMNYNYTAFGMDMCYHSSSGRNYKISSCYYDDKETKYRYSDLDGWNIMDLYDNRLYEEGGYKPNTKLYYLYNNIKNKDWIDNPDVFIDYSKSDSVFDVKFNETIKTKFFTLNKNDFDGSLLIGKSWLYNVDTVSGILEWHTDNVNATEEGNKIVTLSNGSVSASWNISQDDTACTNGYGSYPHKFAHTIYTAPYYPVIVLKSNVKLKDTKCSKSKSGTKTCPYTLEWVDDVVVDEESE